MDSSVRSHQDIWSPATSPTLLTSTSRPPNWLKTSSAMRTTSLWTAMSACTVTASPPTSLIRATVFSAPAAELR